jgi:hypothetical protein
MSRMEPDQFINDRYLAMEERLAVSKMGRLGGGSQSRRGASKKKGRAAKRLRPGTLRPCCAEQRASDALPPWQCVGHPSDLPLAGHEGGVCGVHSLGGRR